ncbi:MAG: DUF1156 domain-containing protein, partial [Atribacterota bacterium]|nr:DUF1156 domain-containing protein [Atribacterota bacterium]
MAKEAMREILARLKTGKRLEQNGKIGEVKGTVQEKESVNREEVRVREGFGKGGSKVVEQRKKLIEVALPLQEINDASAYDMMPGIGAHPKGIHVWWGRKALPVARAVIFASFVDDPSGHPERFPTEEAQAKERERLFGIIRRMMQRNLHEHPEVYREAQTEMMKYCEGRLPPFLDPFAGGGSIPLEAARLGFEAYAG